MPQFNPFTGWQPVQPPAPSLKCSYCNEEIKFGEDAVSIFTGSAGRGTKTGMPMVVAKVQENRHPFEEPDKEIAYHTECVDMAYMERIMEENGMAGFPDCPSCGGPVTICEHCGHNAASAE